MATEGYVKVEMTDGETARFAERVMKGSSITQETRRLILADMSVVSVGRFFLSVMAANEIRMMSSDELFSYNLYKKINASHRQMRVLLGHDSISHEVVCRAFMMNLLYDIEYEDLIEYPDLERAFFFMADAGGAVSWESIIRYIEEDIDRNLINAMTL